MLTFGMRIQYIFASEITPYIISNPLIKTYSLCVSKSFLFPILRHQSVYLIRNRKLNNNKHIYNYNNYAF